jgi:hypothetical protein
MSSIQLIAAVAAANVALLVVMRVLLPRRRERRTPSMWLAGADPRYILSTHDRARITSMGTMVALTALASVASMTTALTIVFPGPWAWLRHLPVGIFWGLIVLTIDRWLVSSVSYRTLEADEAPAPLLVRFAAGTAGFLARMLMAAVIGLIISEPVVQAIFSPEINNYLSQSHQAVIAAQTTQITERAKAKPTDPTGAVAQAVSDAAKADAAAATTKAVYICELAPTSTCISKLPLGTITGIAGNGPQTQQDYQAWQNAVALQRQRHTELATARATQATRAATVETQRQVDIAQMTARVNADNGLLAREHALSDLTRHDFSMRMTRLAIWFGIMLVDLLPLLLKSLSPRSVYSRAEAAAAIGAVRYATANAVADADADAEIAQADRTVRVAHHKHVVDGEHNDTDDLLDFTRRHALAHDKRRIREQYGEDSEPAPHHVAGTAVEESALDGSVPAEDLAAASGNDGMHVGGRWKIVRPLPGVSHSTTYPPYLAQDMWGEYDGDVVVKLLAPAPGMGEDERELRRALNEMAMPTGFIHENLAEILDSDIDPLHGCYVVTHYYPMTLQDWLIGGARQGELTLGRSLQILRQIFAGLGAAWDRNYVHLDIKPANIAISETGQIKIFDFGLLQNWRLVSGGHGTSDGPKYTQFYAPPEQMRRSENWIQRSADVRAAAATVYRMVTGRPPMWLEALAVGLIDPGSGWLVPDDTALFDFKDLCQEHDPLPLHAFICDIPVPVSDRVSRWLSRDPAARNPGASETFTQRLLLMTDQMIDFVREHALSSLPVGTDAAVDPSVAGLDPSWRSRRHGGLREQSRPATQAMTAYDPPTFIPGLQASSAGLGVLERDDAPPLGPYGDLATGEEPSPGAAAAEALREKNETEDES